MKQGIFLQEDHAQMVLPVVDHEADAVAETLKPYALDALDDLIREISHKNFRKYLKTHNHTRENTRLVFHETRCAYSKGENGANIWIDVNITLTIHPERIGFDIWSPFSTAQGGLYTFSQRGVIDSQEATDEVLEALAEESGLLPGFAIA